MSTSSPTKINPRSIQVEGEFFHWVTEGRVLDLADALEAAGCSPQVVHSLVGWLTLKVLKEGVDAANKNTRTNYRRILACFDPATLSLRRAMPSLLKAAGQAA